MTAHTVVDLYPEIRRHVKNAPEPLMQYALQRSVQEFCKKTWLYEKTIDLLPVANQEVYVLDIASTDEILHIHHVQYDSRGLSPRRSEDSLPSSLSAGGNSPYEYIFESPNLLFLKPTPTNVINPSTGLPFEFRVKAVLQTQDSVDAIPETIYRQHKLILAAGAAAFILCISGEQWTNPEKAAKLDMDFMNGCVEGKRQRMVGFVTKGIRIRPRSFLTS